MSGTISRGATNFFEPPWLARRFNGLASIPRPSQARDSAETGTKSGVDFTFKRVNGKGVFRRRPDMELAARAKNPLACQRVRPFKSGRSAHGLGRCVNYR